MIRQVSLLGLVLLAPVAVYGATCGAATQGAATGAFHIVNGEIIGPDGRPFIARGVNDTDIATNADQLMADFPGLNFVRVPTGPGTDPASFAMAVQKLTAAGIVVEFEDHSSSDGQNRGGGTGTIFTGAQLQNEMAWYASVASYYEGNPNVWLGTDNEPSTINPTTGQNDPAALSAWQLQTYNTIRATGNNNPIMIEINGWGDTNSFAQGYDLADYSGMTNVIGDVHDYGWLSNYSPDQAANDNFLTDAVSSLQSRLMIADGTLPVLIGEYGNSTTGSAIDANGSQVVTAVNTSGYGSVAWNFSQGYPGDGLLNPDGSLSDYGQQVAAYIKVGGCPAVPVAAAPARQSQVMAQATPSIPRLPSFDDGPLPAVNVPPANAPQFPGGQLGPAAADVPNTPINIGNPTVTVRTPDAPRFPTGNAVVPVFDPLPAGAPPLVAMLQNIAAKGMSMIASPIGSWLVKMDATIITGMDTALQGLAPQMALPVGAACLLFLGARGVRIAQGDALALNNLWFNFVKIIIVVGLSTNLGNFDYYVRDLFYTNLPNTLNKAVGGQLVANGVNGTAATFDNIWALMWVQIANVWQQAGLFDVGSRLSAAFCGITVGLALMAMALVYLLARLLLAIVIVFGPICIACTLFEQTKPIFERWMGKVIALICLQVSGIVLLTILLAADRDFMNQIQPLATQAGAGAFGAAGTEAPTVASDLENLVSMVIWFGMGAFAMYALPAIAYSIGTGVATNMTPLLLGLMSAGSSLLSGASELIGGIGEFSLGAAGDFSMDFARDELGGSAGITSLPPPPPHALSHATPPVGE